MPTRSRMPIRAPVSQHWIHSRKKLMKMTTPISKNSSTTIMPSTGQYCRSQSVTEFCANKAIMMNSCVGVISICVSSERRGVHVLQVWRGVDLAHDHLAALDLDALHPAARLDQLPLAEG